MKTLLKLSWRNIWRNKRRTFITVASIFFAVFFSVFMNSVQRGAWVRMLDNVVNFYFGYAQIHQKGFWDEQSIEKAFQMNAEIEKLPQQVSGLEGMVPRLESFALASYGTNTRGVLLIGTNPPLENSLSGLRERVVKGRYFKENENAVLLSEGLAKLLKISLNDTLVLISQGYHGVNAAGKYPVVGLVKFASPDLNKQMAYLPLKVAQGFYGAENLITSLALKIKDKDAGKKVVRAVSDRLGSDDYEVLGWQEMLPDLLEAQKTDAAGNYLFLIVLYIIITFGIFGTILMMTKERSFEFGVLVSIGMNRMLLGFTVWLEVILLGLLGALLGIIGSLPVVYYFHLNPIDLSGFSKDITKVYAKWGFDPLLPAALEWQLFFWQAVLVVAITSVLAIYPIWKIKNLQPVEAMRE